MTNILLVGLGDLGSIIASEALQQGMTVQAMRRQAKGLPGVKLIRHDATSPWPVISDNITDVVLCVAPDSRTDEAYRQAYLVIGEQALCWLSKQPVLPHVWLVSSTSVYGQQHGEWVDEDSPRLPERSTAKILVAAEDRWLQSGLPCTMLRPAGLYGPGRDMMLRIAKNAQHIVEKQPVYTNRIEISDCARAIVHLIMRRQQGLGTENAYNLTDLNPARYSDVIQFLQQQLQIAADQPHVVQRGSKRVSVRRLQQTGFSWQYPDYKTGYLAML
ncbi:Nucleoside-diphosphate-sugar epimerase [Arsukibacterium tuosuense]|uniref:Nucleoside-diphosphate-sugar epimerase n=1 Tax=Arsukibacterium tuosuense TaxID=1323745 RepID=A0A285IZJ5_9GAMM|nr:NAD(P)H-binding protein [Arsukibacterium tuosuense]SNY53404.1 Nucleoside-diphosphate-sugar epimerase [Arsukibacterium tuosuense]